MSENMKELSFSKEKNEQDKLFTLYDPCAVLREEQKKLNNWEVVNRYFEIEKLNEPAYLKEVKELSEQIGKLSEQCRLSIVIPAYQEESRIENTLQSLHRISLPRNLFEVILVVNCSEEESPDKTGYLAEEYKKRAGMENLHILKKKFSKKVAGVGAARKFGSDIALLRYNERLQRNPQDTEFYIAGTDADLVKVPKDHYTEALQQLKTHKYDVLSGSFQINTNTIVENLPKEWWGTHPNISKLLEARNQLAEIKKSILEDFKSFSTAGQDFFIQAAAYARIGGIQRLKTGEDTAISTRAARTGLHCGSLKAEPIITSSRRAVIDFIDMLADTTAAYTPDRFMEMSKKIRKVGSTEKDVFNAAKEIPDLADGIIRNYVRNEIKAITKAVSLQKDIYLDIVFNRVLDVVRKKVEAKQVPFSMKELEDGLFEDLKKDVLLNIVRNTKLGREYKKRAEDSLKLAKSGLEKTEHPINAALDLIAKAKEYYLAKKQESLIRLDIFKILYGTAEKDFSNIYEKKVKLLEVQRQELEKKARNLSLEMEKKAWNKGVTF